MKVPNQLMDTRFRVVKARGKAPNVERNWQKINNYEVTQERIELIISSGLNYGFTCPSGFSCFIDADTPEIQEELDSFAYTFRYSTGTPGHFQYAYFIEDEPVGCHPLVDGAYIKGKGGFTVGPGSVHPNGNIYGKEIREVAIAVVKKGALLRALSPFSLSKTQSNRSVPEYNRFHEVDREQVNDLVEELVELWSKADGRRHDLVLAIVGLLERRGWNQGKIQALADELIRESGKGHEHSAQVRYAYGRGSHKWGLPMIKAIATEVEDVH